MPTRKGGPRPPRERMVLAEPQNPRGVQQPVPRAAVAQPGPAVTEPAAGPVPKIVPAAEPAKKGRRRNPLFPAGVSLYPLDEESAGWDAWYSRDVADDLSLLESARFGLVRVFVSWRVLEPQVGQYDEAGLRRLADLVSAARAAKLETIVCLFGDDRHADLLDVPWGRKRDPRTDAYLIQREISLAQRVVGMLAADQGVFAWQLANEAFLSGFEDKHELDEWTMLLREAVREVDPKRPMALGIDAETFYRQTGVDARDAVESCEFSVSHVTSSYRAFAAEGPVTSGPSTYLESYLLRIASRGKPVLLDDIGTLSLDFSPAEEAAFARVSLWSGLANRAAGALGRRLRDLVPERREPYYLDPFETLVGLVDSTGGVKPSFSEYERFVRSAAAIDLKKFIHAPERTAILIPSERFNPLPDLACLFDPRACLAAFVGAKRAHLPVTVIHEADDYADYSVLIVPSAFKLAEETWERLAGFAQAGGALILSYGGGDAHPGIRDLFGVEFCGDAGPRATLSCRVAQHDLLGPLVSFDARFDVSNYALLSGGTATVVATDEHGNPLLTINTVGHGRAVYIAAPLERAIAQGDPWATPAPVAALLREVYGAVARSTGCGAPITCDGADVEVGLLQGDGEDVLILINHSPEKVTTTLSTDRCIAAVTQLRGSSPVAVDGSTFGITLEPNGALGVRLTYS